MTAPRPDAAPPALLPCPFCGEFPHEQAHHDWPCGFAFVCVSSNCNIRPTTRLQEFRADAIAAWNRRAPATDAPAPVTDAEPTDEEVRHADNGLHLRNESVRKVLREFLKGRSPSAGLPYGLGAGECYCTTDARCHHHTEAK